MKDFKTEKEKLLSELKSRIKRNPENQTLKTFILLLNSYNSAADLNGALSHIVVDSLDSEFKMGEKLINFENHFSDLSNSIISTDLRRLAKLFIKENVHITFYGKAWSENTANWMYFDKVFDLKILRAKMSFGDHIIDHQNLDSKSGLEIGFIDKSTGEGIMGKLK
jgi:hypothetical protein